MTLTSSQILVSFGLALALGGVARLMMNSPSLDAADKTKQRASYLFSGVVNVGGQGECVPVLFGEMIVGSSAISAGVESQDVGIDPSRRGDPLGGGIGYESLRLQ